MAYYTPSIDSSQCRCVLRSKFALLAGSTAFASMAFYINVVEHPALMTLDDKNALKHWKAMCSRAAKIQASIALFTGFVGTGIAYRTGEKIWLVGASLMFLNWPYTYIFLMPINNKLKSTSDESAGPETRVLLRKWNPRHAVRTVLGFAAIGVFAYAIMKEIK